jgi:hypothetical protein
MQTRQKNTDKKLRIGHSISAAQLPIHSSTILTHAKKQKNIYTLFPVLTPLGSKEARRVGRVGSEERVGSKDRKEGIYRVRHK